MKTLLRGLTLAAVLMTGAVTQAEIVLDTFSSANATSFAGAGVDSQGIANGITRTVTLGGLGAIDIGSTDGLLDAVLTSNGSFLELAYDLTGAASSFRGFFVDQVLRTGFNVTSGTNAFVVSLTATSAGFTTASFNSGVAVAVPSQFNMLQTVSGPGGNGHLASFANVDVLTMRITKLGSGLNVFFNSSSGISAIPEPASMTLLGLTAIGGVFAFRRRKLKLAA